MTFKEYQELAQRTSNGKSLLDINHCAVRIINGVIGLSGEAGECADIVKKWLFQGHDLDRNKLIDEISDVLWYCAEAATGLGVSLDEIAEHNIEKLRKRYPDGFDAERSIHRNE